MTPDPATPPTEIAGYRIERALATGTMSSVYLVHSPNLPRREALKVLSAELAHDGRMRTRFHQEADITASLDHRNIVSVFNRGETGDGQLWMAMEYVDGHDAETVLRAGAMTPQRALHIIAGVAQALDYAHPRGIVHQDIKPSNFLLGRQPGQNARVVLSDFGVALIPETTDPADSPMTATLAYAAPEVITGTAVDGRADVYSLGCTLFRLLTGLYPFPGDETVPAIVKAHLEQAPPQITEHLSWATPQLDHVIAKALAKDSAHRYPTAGELAAAAAEAVRAATAKASPRAAAATPSPLSSTGGGPARETPPVAAATAAPSVGVAKAAPAATPVDPAPAAITPARPAKPAPPAAKTSPTPAQPRPWQSPVTPAAAPIRVTAARDSPLLRPVAASGNSAVAGSPTPAVDFITHLPRAQHVASKRGIVVGAGIAVTIVMIGLIVWLALPESAPEVAPQSSSPPTTTVTTPSSDATARLARSLPAGYRAGACNPTGTNAELAAAALACGPNTDRGGPSSATYTLARNTTALRALFDHEVAGARGVVCPGNIQSPGPWKRLANPTVPQGTVFCGLRDGRPMIAWTTNDRLLCATIEAASADDSALAQLYTWWTGHS